MIYQVKAKLCQEKGPNELENHLMKEFKGLNIYPDDNFVDVNPIGQGEFGVVEKAILLDGSARHPVALKTVKNSSDRTAIVSTYIIGHTSNESRIFFTINLYLKIFTLFIDLLQAKLEDEMKIMQCMDYHTHIVNLQGFKINQPDPTFSMVLEYCSKGSLFKYLGKY